MKSLVCLVGLLLSADLIHPGEAVRRNAREEKQVETTTTTTTTTTPLQGEINIQAVKTAAEPGEAEKATARKKDRSAAAESEELIGPDGAKRTFFLIDQKVYCGSAQSMCQAKGAQLAQVSAPWMDKAQTGIGGRERTKKAWLESNEGKFLKRYLQNQFDSLKSSTTRDKVMGMGTNLELNVWVASSGGGRSDHHGNVIQLRKEVNGFMKNINDRLSKLLAKSRKLCQKTKTCPPMPSDVIVDMKFHGYKCFEAGYGIPLCERKV